jgi:hypothetical protein
MTTTHGASAPTLTPTAEKALATICNLRKLSRETGCISTRAQHDVLRKLNSEDFAAVADALAME